MSCMIAIYSCPSERYTPKAVADLTLSVRQAPLRQAKESLSGLLLFQPIVSILVNELRHVFDTDPTAFPVFDLQSTR